MADTNAAVISIMRDNISKISWPKQPSSVFAWAFYTKDGTRLPDANWSCVDKSRIAFVYFVFLESDLNSCPLPNEDGWLVDSTLDHEHSAYHKAAVWRDGQLDGT